MKTEKVNNRVLLFCAKSRLLDAEFRADDCQELANILESVFGHETVQAAWDEFVSCV